MVLLAVSPCPSVGSRSHLVNRAKYTVTTPSHFPQEIPGVLGAVYQKQVQDQIHISYYEPQYYTLCKETPRPQKANKISCTVPLKEALQDLCVWRGAMFVTKPVFPLYCICPTSVTRRDYPCRGWAPPTVSGTLDQAVQHWTPCISHSLPSSSGLILTAQSGCFGPPNPSLSPLFLNCKHGDV